MILGHPAISEYFKGIFGGKVRKIAVNAGLNCPNRDGSIGTGGCIFCNNKAFNPSYAYDGRESITSQISKGLSFTGAKADDCAILPYFQTYSNTYGPTDRLISLYEEALAYPGVKGLVIATRPDCLQEDLLEYFSNRFGNKAPDPHPYLLLELGVESTKDETLEIISRGHDFACAKEALYRLDRLGIHTGVHIILGLPGEDSDDYILHARRISELPVRTLKLHQLQIVKGSLLEDIYAKNPDVARLFTPETYAAAVRSFLRNLRSDIAIDRLVSETPKDMIVAPAWGLKPSQFQELL